MNRRPVRTELGSLVRRALFRATLAAIVAGCLIVTAIGFTQPWLLFAW